MTMKEINEQETEQILFGYSARIIYKRREDGKDVWKL